MGQNTSSPSFTLAGIGSNPSANPLPPPPDIDFSSVLPTELPRDPTDNRFVQSFPLDSLDQDLASPSSNGSRSQETLQEQLRSISEFFETYGFVVIRNVLTREQIDRALNDIWNVIEGKDPLDDTVQVVRGLQQQKSSSTSNKNVNGSDDGDGGDHSEFVAPDRNNPLTWTPNHGYPAMENVGILGTKVALQRSAMENRQNELVYTVFSHLLNGERQLLVSMDRFGVIRPTKQVLMADGVTRQDFPRYGTREKWMHWDMNPFKLIWTEEQKERHADGRDVDADSADEVFMRNPDAFFITENNETLAHGTGHYQRKLQGFLALSDATEDDGGFICVPTFHKHVEEWARANQEYYGSKFVSDFVSVPTRDPLCGQGLKVPVRAGSLVVWDSRLPHCNFPNQSDKFRYVQYVKMFPKRRNAPKFNESRRMLMEAMMRRANFQPSELGMKLFGLAEWDEE